MALSEHVARNNGKGSHSHGTSLDEFSSLKIFVGHDDR